MSNKPKILGGKIRFPKPIPVIKPTLPSFDSFINNFKKITHSGMLTNASYVELFEKKTREYIKSKYTIALASCTSGLILVLKTLGIKGKVILPSFTFVATAHAVLWNNLQPIFVDVDPQTFNLNPDVIKQSDLKQASALLVTYTFGNPPDMNKLQKLASKYGLKLIFDAAHAFGSEYKNKKAGNFGDAEVFSLSPTKIITSAEGGIVSTQNPALANTLRIARNYGSPPDYDTFILGLNARMTEYHATIGIVTLNNIDKTLKYRYNLVHLYKKCLSSIPGITFQKILPDSKSTYKDFTVVIEPKKFGMNRNQLAYTLAMDNVMTKKYFYPPVHMQKLYKSSFYKRYNKYLSVTNYLSKNVLSLPLYSHMTKTTVHKICNLIHDIHFFHKEIKKRLIL